MKRNLRVLTLVMVGLALAAPRAMAQNPTVSLQFTVPGPADWNTATNWVAPDTGENFVPGMDFPDEVVGISNGGTAVLDASAFEITGILLGETGQFPENGPETGTLNLLPGADLTVSQSVLIGADGLGVLNMTGGGLSATRVVVGGDDASALNLGGGAMLDVSGAANLERNVRLTGPNVAFGVGEDLTLRGRLTAEITGPAHSAINVAASANIGGTLQVEFNGHTPSIGDRWTLIDANNLSGVFQTVSTTTPLQDGLRFGVRYNEGGGGDVALNVENFLTLTIDRGTGEAVISNQIGTIDFDGYSIQSPFGSLDPTAWTSLEDGTVTGWDEANPTNTHLNELNLSGSTALGAGQSQSLGAPFRAPTAFGQLNQDVTFEYHLTGESTVPGVVKYTGPENTLVVFVDPTTGAASIKNDSLFEVAVDAYAIGSASGSLDPTTWTSFADAGLDGGGWDEANPTTTHLNELNINGSTLLGGGESIAIGSPFDAAGGLQDLTFQFHLAGGFTLPGVVRYESLAPDLPGDTNGDGVVDLEDLNNVRNNFGAVGMPVLGDTNDDGVVDLEDLNAVRNNFGAMLAGAARAVPEPASSALAGLGVLLLLAAGRASRRRRLAVD